LLFHEPLNASHGELVDLFQRSPKEQGMSVKLVRWGNAAALIIPNSVAKMPGFKAGSFVRVIAVGRDLRIRPVAVPRVDDHVSFEDHEEQDTDQQDETSGDS
jgi:antitoxin component of MazEF toxin-antitoxin module